MKDTTTFEDFEKGKKGAAVKKRRGPVRHVSVKPVAGGFVSEAEHEDMGNGNEPMMYMSNRTKKHHKTAEDVGSHISKMFGGKEMVAAGDNDADDKKG